MYRDNLVTRAAAIEEGMKKGMEIGMEKGMEKGMEIGSRDANIKTARNMKADGLPVDFIVKYTGLTAKEIEAL